MKSYPGFETDSCYGWIKESTKGAEGMPLNVQVVGLPWNEEIVLRVMKELEIAAKFTLLE
jgi:fatty acid amide hydrolase